MILKIVVWLFSYLFCCCYTPCLTVLSWINKLSFRPGNKVYGCVTFIMCGKKLVQERHKKQRHWVVKHLFVTQSIRFGLKVQCLCFQTAAFFAEDIVWSVTASLIAEDSARQLLSFFAQDILLPRKQQCQGMWAEI